jgi:hypothetical protein
MNELVKEETARKIGVSDRTHPRSALQISEEGCLGEYLY